MNEIILYKLKICECEIKQRLGVIEEEGNKQYGEYDRLSECFNHLQNSIKSIEDY
jgi:hypothetical protein